jgi:hypothetical protein
VEWDQAEGMGSSRRNNSGAELANTTLVFQTDAAANRDSLDHTEEQNNSAATMGSTQGSSPALTLLACQILYQGILRSTRNICSAQQQVLETQFWKTTVYQSHINRWKTYCGKRQIDFIRILIVLDFFVQLWDIGSHNRYHLKRLTAEVDILIALVSAQKRQSIPLLNIDYMVKDDTSYVFTIKDHIKQSRPGYMPPSIELKAFPHNPNSCIVSTLNKYINRAAA